MLKPNATTLFYLVSRFWKNDIFSLNIPLSKTGLGGRSGECSLSTISILSVLFDASSDIECLLKRTKNKKFDGQLKNYKKKNYLSSSRNFVDRLLAVMLCPGATGWYLVSYIGIKESADGSLAMPLVLWPFSFDTCHANVCTTKKTSEKCV